MANERSPNYPSLSLPEAVAALTDIYKKEKRTPVPIDVAAKAMGYTSVSGPVRTKIAALRKYGLLNAQNSSFRVSDLGMRVIHSVPESEDFYLAAREAAMLPVIFRELYESHLEGSDDALKSYLMIRKGFSESGAKQLTRAFRETIGFAKLENSGYTPSGQTNSEGDEMQAEQNTGASFRQSGVVPQGSTSQQGAKTAKVFTWPLSKDVSAEVRFNGGEVKPAHLELLAKYLELAKLAIESEEQQ